MLNPPRTLTHHPLFQTMLILQNNTRHHTTLGDLEVQSQPATPSGAKFDLSFSVGEVDGGGLAGVLEYATDLFDRTTAQSLSQRLTRTLTALAHHPTTPISHIDILSPPERHQLLIEWNDTQREVPPATLPALFEAQAAATPHNVAVVCQDTELTYAELNTRANRLAHLLIDHGIGPERAVALMMERSADLVVAVIGVAKSGGWCLPLHEAYPDARVKRILDETHPLVLLADEVSRERASSLHENVVVLTPDVMEGVEHQANPGVDLHPHHPAYVIYTSGSTGRPKGVVATQSNVVDLVEDECWRSGHERVLLHSPHAFDASTYETWVPLLSGGTIVVAPPGALDPESLRAAISGQKVSAIFLTTGLFNLVVDEDPSCLSGASQIWTGGNSASAAAFERARNAVPDTRIIHVYGPTEATTFATFQYTDNAHADLATVPIGSPMSNTRLYVLDDVLGLVPPGVVGELYVAGGGRVSYTHLTLPTK
ncbi:AMP-binding protein, partial [Streptomyces sp. SBT349]|uniref:AMP-binding protein n=1 Tax=Streptomyces sp. SBT349 TaxID=1580539 RepID=UPI001F24E29B